MAVEHQTRDENLAYQRAVALQYTLQKKYKDLADLVAENQKLAKVGGKAIVDAMYNSLFTTGKDFSYGHQLTGDQLRILAYARKAGAPVGEGDITIRFDYVARIEREGRGYQARFPDLEGTNVNEKTLTETEKLLKESLASYIGVKMVHGDTLPAPKYHGRKTKTVRPFKVQLTLADLVFEDKMTPEEAAKLQAAIHTDKGFL